MDAERATVAALLPHGPGMVLLDALHGHGVDAARFAVTMRPDAPFAERGRGVPAWVGIEYMAQALAACEGLTRRADGKPIQIGLLLGCRDYRCSVPYFPVGATLQVHVQLLVRDGQGVTAFECRIEGPDGVRATAQIKAYMPDDIEEYLRGLNA